MNRQVIRLIAFLIIGLGVGFIGSFMFDHGQYVEPTELHGSSSLGVLVEQQRELRENKQQLFESIKIIDEKLKEVNEEVTKQQYSGLNYMNPEYLKGFE